VNVGGGETPFGETEGTVNQKQVECCTEDGFIEGINLGNRGKLRKKKIVNQVNWTRKRGGLRKKLNVGESSSNSQDVRGRQGRAGWIRETLNEGVRGRRGKEKGNVTQGIFTKVLEGGGDMEVGGGL